MFVLLDDFQFQRHSFHQRNRIRLADATPLVDTKWRQRLKTTLDQSSSRSTRMSA